MKAKEYMLAVGDEGVSRLDLLNEITGAYTQEFLKSIGLKSGMAILDVGCGTGNTAIWLAQQVGEAGKVVGVDISSDQLKVAEERAKTLGLKNIEFISLSIYELEKLGRQFDLVFSRFLLMHLAQPEQALIQMHQCVKSGGVLACDDHDLGAIESIPPSESLHNLKELIYKVAGKDGLDFDIGKKLYEFFRKLNLSDIRMRVVQPTLMTPRHKMLFPLFFVEVRENFLASHLISEQEYDALVEDITAISRDEGAYILAARNFQISGKKS